MTQQVLKGLQVKSGGNYCDATIGGAGHAEAILEVSSPNGCLLGFDRDGDAVEAAKKRLERFEGRVEIRRGNFSEMADHIAPGSMDGILYDLGVSSHQLDTRDRGFSFLQDGDLDMRMDRRQELKAADVVNEFSAEELAKIFWELGDESHSRRIARAIEMDRRLRPFTRTRELAELIERLVPRHGKKIHPATKVFQALRVYVNDELGSLLKGLEAGFRVLKPGGRLAILVFQSDETRVVRKFGDEMTRDYEFEGPVDDPLLRKPREPLMRWVQRKAMTPDDEETAANPRSRSTQLRILEKI